MNYLYIYVCDSNIKKKTFLDPGRTNTIVGTQLVVSINALHVLLQSIMEWGFLRSSVFIIGFTTKHVVNITFVSDFLITHGLSSCQLIGSDLFGQSFLVKLPSFRCIRTIVIQMFHERDASKGATQVYVMIFVETILVSVGLQHQIQHRYCSDFRCVSRCKCQIQDKDHFDYSTIY